MIVYILQKKRHYRCNARLLYVCIHIHWQRYRQERTYDLL